MKRWVVRLGLVRVLGRRAVPLLLLYDGLQVARSVRRWWTEPDTKR